MGVKRRMAALLAASLLLPLAACGGGGGDSGDKSITLWLNEDIADRVRATQRIVDGFTKASGIKVKLVSVAEDQLQQQLTANAAAGNLPDVIGALPLAAVHFMATNDLIDQEATGAVLNALGPSSFDAQAVRLTRYEGKPAAVPFDAWTQLLVYRKDLFEKAELPPPETYDRLRDAAAKLNKGGVAGITLATTPGEAFTEQTFEFLANGNGCELVDARGTVTIGSPACVETFRLYTDLAGKYSVKGNQNDDFTRATYFAGKAAMVVWSPFILDEMAGLRKDALPTCPQCAKDPAFLARNSGFVTALRGPNASGPGGFGEVSSWAVLKGGATEPAKRFLQYMGNEGYLDWIKITPEGRFPLRKGTATEPERFVSEWARLPVGVDEKKPMSDFYPPEVIEGLRAGVSEIDRWGLKEGQGKLLGATLGELPVPKAVSDAVSGRMTPEQAAAQAQRQVEQIQKELR
ncbi:ABC transporter substrate-binding protein [Bailinhaonella thermotolerans]|uniref:Extracellular solute-binding protein n=1 Tax=Bailinhaonella thermotolerans TaxID=1070861 RepID=A0A3A4AKR8_9ACTN|nr:extracellular solute-binding protein [Bailinhaonella thermotolerans]RJL21707.1 extracellular solute-binding protein [Bailinhaonella thermotolerans]